MCSVTWKRAFRLVFCVSRDVGSACRPTFKMPPRLGWPACATAAVGCAAGAGAAVGLAAAAVVGAAGVVVGFAAATAVGAAAGAVVGLAAGGVVGAGGDGAAGAVAGPHADTSSMPAHSKPSDGRTQSIGNDPLMEAPDYTIKRRPCSGPEHKKGASA